MTGVADLIGEVSGWTETTLGSVARVDRGVSWSKPQESWAPRDEHVPVLRIGNVQLAGIKLQDVLYVGGISAAHRVKKSIRPETIVMVGSNGNVDRVGNAFLAGARCEGFLYASFLIGVTPHDPGVASYVAYWLRSPDVQAAISAATAGSVGLKNISLKWLRALPVVMPPPDQMARVVGLLTSVEAAAEAASAKHEALGSLRDALINEIVDSALSSVGQSAVEVDL